MTTWDSTVDFVIVGSGGGGMVAALTAADAGASALVLEKQKLLGGSTAMSGGIVWVPNNPVMRSIGVPDSYEDAMVHFEAVVGDVGPCSLFERREAFLTAGPEMVAFLQLHGDDAAGAHVTEIGKLVAAHGTGGCGEHGIQIFPCRFIFRQMQRGGDGLALLQRQ